MSTEENKAVVRRYIEAIDNNDSSDWSVLDEFVAEDVVVHNPQLPGVTADREGIKQAAEMFRQATPGRHEIPLQVAEGDLVVSLIVGFGRTKVSCWGSRRPGTRSRRKESRSTASWTARSPSTGA